LFGWLAGWLVGCLLAWWLAGQSVRPCSTTFLNTAKLKTANTLKSKEMQSLETFKLSSITLNQLVSLQNDLLELPGVGNSINDIPIALKRLLEYDNLVPLHYSWDWTKRVRHHRQPGRLVADLCQPCMRTKG